ncbi:MAG: acyltransferase [Myxococcota bacterium]
MSFATDLWHRAADAAHATPDERNRYVDFLRAASILVVIVGHWLVAAPYVSDAGALVAGNMLELAPWTRWLTLAVQVMPIFFLVGGYANHVAWTSAIERGTPYPRWLAGRFQRLIAPVIPVLLAWVAIALVAGFAGADPSLVGLLSQAALVPTWFLAVYVMVGVLVPITYRAWQRHGFRSFWALVAGALVTDVVSFGAGNRSLGLVNYFFVWLAIHQLGYAWREGRFQKRLVWAAGGAAATALLVAFGPYPLAMVGFPGMEVSNTSPPTLALLTLGIAQSGLVLAAEPFVRRVLDDVRVWTATVLVNGLIMTVYLWHMTAMLAVYALLYVAGTGLELVPNTADWWTTRPVYLLAFALFLFPLTLVVQRFEKPAAALAETSRRRLVAAATLVCAGLAMISAQGVASAEGLRILPNLLPFWGAGLAGVGPLKAIATIGLSGTGRNTD